MKTSAFLVFFMCLALTACGEESKAVAALPREPDSHVVGYYCRMTLSEHSGPKGQLLLKGATDPLWFTSVRDALIYVDQDLPSENEIAGFWVNDMGQGTWEKPAPGSWIAVLLSLIETFRVSGTFCGSDATAFSPYSNIFAVSPAIW